MKRPCCDLPESFLSIRSLHGENQRLLSVCQGEPVSWKSVSLCRSSALKCQVLSHRNKDRCLVALAWKVICAGDPSSPPSFSPAQCTGFIISRLKDRLIHRLPPAPCFRDQRAYIWEEQKVTVRFGCWKRWNHRATFNLVKALFSAGFLATQMSNYSPSPVDWHEFRLFDGGVHRVVLTSLWHWLSSRPAIMLLGLTGSRCNYI